MTLVGSDGTPSGAVPSLPKEGQEEDDAPGIDFRSADDFALPCRSSRHQAPDRILDRAGVTWQRVVQPVRGSPWSDLVGPEAVALSSQCGS